MQVHGQSSLWLDLSLAACVGSSFFLGGAKEEQRASPQVAGRGHLVHFSFEELAKQSGDAAPNHFLEICPVLIDNEKMADGDVKYRLS